MHSSVLGLARKPSAIPWSVALICPPPDYTAPTRRNESSLKTRNDCQENGDYKNNYNRGNNNNKFPQTMYLTQSSSFTVPITSIHSFQHFQIHHEN